MTLTPTLKEKLSDSFEVATDDNVVTQDQAYPCYVTQFQMECIEEIFKRLTQSKSQIVEQIKYKCPKCQNPLESFTSINGIQMGERLFLDCKVCGWSKDNQTEKEKLVEQILGMECMNDEKVNQTYSGDVSVNGNCFGRGVVNIGDLKHYVNVRNQLRLQIKEEINKL